MQKIIPLRNFRCVLQINELCVQFINCFTLYKENFTSFYALWAQRHVVWNSVKNKKR